MRIEGDVALIAIDQHIIALDVTSCGPINGVEWPFGLSIGARPDGN